MPLLLAKAIIGATSLEDICPCCVSSTSSEAEKKVAEATAKGRDLLQLEQLPLPLPHLRFRRNSVVGVAPAAKPSGAGAWSKRWIGVAFPRVVAHVAASRSARSSGACSWRRRRGNSFASKSEKDISTLSSTRQLMRQWGRQSAAQISFRISHVLALWRSTDPHCAQLIQLHACSRLDHTSTRSKPWATVSSF